MTARLVSGWLCVPYDGHDLAKVAIGIGPASGDVEWRPAFLDTVDGHRVAKIRPRDVSGSVRVWLRTNGVVTSAGRLTL